MRRVLLVIALAFGISASPAPAQQTAPDGTALNEPPPPPPAAELPPPAPRASTELPPPFPHFPRAKPREHDPNWRGGAHKHRSAASNHHRATSHHASRIRSKTHHRASPLARAKTRRPAHVYFSKRTTRQCHRMDYSQIMHYPNCRTMMRQDLAAAEHRRHAARHKSSHRGSTRHHKAHRRRG